MRIFFEGGIIEKNRTKKTIEEGQKTVGCKKYALSNESKGEELCQGVIVLLGKNMLDDEANIYQSLSRLNFQVHIFGLYLFQILLMRVSVGIGVLQHGLYLCSSSQKCTSDLHFKI